MSSFPACDASLARAQQYNRDNGYPVWDYCTTLHCDETQSYNHQFCYCQGMFTPQPGQTCQNGIGSLIPITSPPPSCYCCCSCFAWNTPIAVDATQVKAVQDFEINDLVWVAKDAQLSGWEQKKIKFSSGTGENGSNRMIKVHFGDYTQGINLTPDSFTSALVTKEQSERFFKILSTDPNDFIGNKGLVNLLMVRKVNPDTIAKLLGVPEIIGHEVYDLLKQDSNYVIVTGSQPFLTDAGIMKKAEKLVPGLDKLVKSDGSFTPIISLEVGMYKKGVHHIATSDAPATSVGGHLLVANGIVVGDYSIQISMTSAGSGIADTHKDEPAFGTKEYTSKHGHLIATPFSAKISVEHIHETKHFEPNHEDFIAKIPDHAFSFLTDREARKLEQNAPIYPASHNLAGPDVAYLFRLFKGVYPEINFYYDEHNMEPNAYSFEEYGQQFVIINGGWTLIEGLYYQGIALTIAQLVARLQNNKNGLSPVISPVGKADYDVFVIFNVIFYFAPPAAMNFTAAVGQIEKIFDLIDEKRSPAKRIGLECRLSCFNASFQGKPLPSCAGGPPDPALELKNVSVEAGTGTEGPKVTLDFNLPVDPSTAEDIGNYLFDPRTAVFNAKVSSDDMKQVVISAQIAKGIEYNIVVTGVLSEQHQPMVVGKNGGTFKLNS